MSYILQTEDAFSKYPLRYPRPVTTILEYLKSQQVNVISLPEKNATAEAKHRQGVKILNSGALVHLQMCIDANKGSLLLSCNSAELLPAALKVRHGR